MSGLDREGYGLLREIVSRREPRTLELLDALRERWLTDGERRLLRELVADELVDRGLDDADEPTAYGLRIEDLIDALGE